MKKAGDWIAAHIGALLAYVAVVVSLTALLIGIVSLKQNRDIRDEAKARVNQTCALFESGHLSDVNQLRQTYDYLDGLSRKQAHSPLNQFIIITLPQLEEKARHDPAPDFCDKTNSDGSPVGLPEPDPVLPPEENFSRLLRRK